MVVGRAWGVVWNEANFAGADARKADASGIWLGFEVTFHTIPHAKTVNKAGLQKGNTVKRMESLLRSFGASNLAVDYGAPEREAGADTLRPWIGQV